MKAVVAEVGMLAKVVEIDGSLDSVSGIVGGYIEHLGILDYMGIDLYVNDEGLYRCEPNRILVYTPEMVEAGYLSQYDYRHVGKVAEPYCQINGNIVALAHDGDEWVGLTDEQAEYAKAYLDIGIVL